MISILVLSPAADTSGLSDALERAGMHVNRLDLPISLAAVAELVRRLRRRPPDAMIYDLGAPSGRRIDAFREIRAMSVARDVPSLVLTSDADGLHRVLGPMAIYDVVLESPADPAVVLRTITILLEDRGRGRAS